MSDRANSLPLSPVELAEVREIAAHAEFETSAVGRLFATIDALDAELQQLGDGVNPALERFRLRQTIDSLTARSSEITDEAVEAALKAWYEENSVSSGTWCGAHIAMREALQAAEATRQP